MKHVFCAVLLFAAGIAHAGDSQQPAPASTTATEAGVPATDDDERMVCERRKVLGSNRPERVCKTVAQRREEKERARADMDRLQRR